MSSKQYFEKVAHEWDHMRNSFFHENVRDRAIQEAHIERGSVVADIGAGSGFITEGLVDMPVKIIAIDQSPNMIDVMKSKFHTYENIDYRVGESEDLPVKENEVNHVFANMFLHHVDDPRESILELYRILKPGGQLIITDLDKHNHEFLRTEQHDKWLGFEREDIRSWFASSGFHDILIDNVGETCSSQSETNDELADVSVFIATGKK